VHQFVGRVLVAFAVFVEPVVDRSHIPVDFTSDKNCLAKVKNRI
jgi:hypothetical protein